MLTRINIHIIRWLTCAAAGVAVLSAAANVRGQATTVQLPTFGISIDAEGVLRLKSARDAGGQLRRLRQQALAAAPPGMQGRSALRMVSLRRLETALQAQLDAGNPPTPAMLHLAGLQRLQFVFLYPEENDIIIAGPAEPWMHDLAGRVVGVETGRPMLELDHLVTALRAFPPQGRPPVMVGCTIDPTQEGLARLQAFQKRVPRSVRQNQRKQVAAFVERGVRESLGMARIRVFGVPADTHFAHVLIEADYRMKLIGIGLEPAPIKLASYIQLLRPTAASNSTLQRWWFTPNYQCVRLTDDRLGMELVGQGVQLMSEAKRIAASGQLTASPGTNRASELFTLGFTRKYPELAAKSPVFAQLRNLVDMAVVAAFLQKENAYARVGWRLSALAREDAYPVRGKPTPKSVAAAANSIWKGNRLLTPAGGGVEITAQKALAPKNLLPDETAALKNHRAKVGRKKPTTWWWD